MKIQKRKNHHQRQSRKIIVNKILQYFYSSTLNNLCVCLLYKNSNRRGRPPKQGLPFDDYNDDEPEHGKKYRLDDKESNSDTTQEDGNGKQSSFVLANYCHVSLPYFI